jgi:hypothetical protein
VTAGTSSRCRPLSTCVRLLILNHNLPLKLPLSPLWERGSGGEGRPTAKARPYDRDGLKCESAVPPRLAATRQPTHRALTRPAPLTMGFRIQLLTRRRSPNQLRSDLPPSRPHPAYTYPAGIPGLASRRRLRTRLRHRQCAKYR